MGLFDRIFSSDPAKDLARAEKLLARGSASEALDVAQRALDKGAGPGAETLVARAREALVASALESAGRAEASEYFEDAADWLQGVLEHVDEARRKEFEHRIADLRRREEKASRPEIPSVIGVVEASPEAEVEGGSLDPDDLYEVYLESLREDVAPRFSGRPQAFRHAVVRLNEGDHKTALEALDALVAENPDDPILRLERGRARLAAEDAEASEDLERAWDALGAEPLDRAGHLSLPALWGDTRLSQGEAGLVAERLAPLAEPRGSDLELTKVFGQALLAQKQFEEAAPFLAQAWDSHPRVHDLPFLLALALRGRQNPDDAIAVLERAVAPACGPAGCSPSALHLPSMHLLMELHLEAGDPERTRELLELVAGVRGGRLGRKELLLMAGYYDKIGDEGAARDARERAEGAAEADMGGAQPGPGPADRGPLGI